MNIKYDLSISPYKYLNKGSNSVVYQINSIKFDFKRYQDSELVLKIFGNTEENINLDNFINKYNKDINQLNIDDNIIDILYYGKIIIDKNINYNYIITPKYSTDFWVLESDKKLLLIENILKLIQKLNNKQIIFNDLNGVNLGYIDTTPIIIDYDEFILDTKYKNTNSLIP
jgi:hypothetical protein